MIETADLETFAKVIELQSVTRAAQALNLPKSTISRRLTRLEAELGTRLVHRSTQGIRATEHGTTFFEYASRSLGLLRDGVSAVQVEQERPRGVVRLALPANLEHGLFAPVLAAFMLAHPSVRLVTSRTSGDPFSAGCDIAIMADTLPHAEASLAATKLCTIDHALYAAPDYAERHGMPQSHVDLSRFDLIACGGNGGRSRLTLMQDGAEVSIDISPRLVCDAPLLVLRAVLAGLGIAALPRAEGHPYVEAGQLIEMLAASRPIPRTLYAVFPHAQALPLRVRSLLNFLIERLRPLLAPVSAGPGE